MSLNQLVAPCPHCPDSVGRAQVESIAPGFVSFRLDNPAALARGLSSTDLVRLHAAATAATFRCDSAACGRTFSFQESLDGRVAGVDCGHLVLAESLFQPRAR